MNIEIKHNSTPPSTQHIYQYVALGRHKLRKFMTPQAKKWKEDFLVSVKKSLPKGYKVTSNDLFMNLTLTFGTKHKHDVDNYSKIILDTMNGVVYEDDSQIGCLVVIKNYKKGEPSITINIGIKEDK